MKRFSFFQRLRADEKLAVIFDIGSASVGAALVGFSRNSLPKVFYTMRQDIPIKEKLDAERLTSSMLSTLGSVARDIQKEGFPHVQFTLFGSIKPALIFYVLAGPWHASQVRVVHKREDNPFRLDRELFQHLISHELGEFRDAHIVGAANSAHDEEYEIIESDILDIKLNRYRVDNPLGRTARELEMTLFASSAPRSLIQAIKEIGNREFAGAESRFSSFTFSFFNAVRDIWHTYDNFLLLDISGEITDLSIVKDGVLLETVSFPVGKNTMLRDIANSLDVSITEAESILQMHQGRALQEQKAERVEHTLKRSGELWLKFFTEELRGISSQILLPRTIFLTADNILLPWFNDSIISREMKDITPGGETFEVVLLNEKTLAQYCHVGEGRFKKDPFLIVESLFLNKILSMV